MNEMLNLSTSDFYLHSRWNGARSECSVEDLLCSVIQKEKHVHAVSYGAESSRQSTARRSGAVLISSASYPKSGDTGKRSKGKGP